MGGNENVLEISICVRKSAISLVPGRSEECTLGFWGGHLPVDPPPSSRDAWRAGGGGRASCRARALECHGHRLLRGGFLSITRIIAFRKGTTPGRGVAQRRAKTPGPVFY